MFGLFKKKSQLEQLIAKEGMECASAKFAEIVSQRLPTRAVAYKFILEELDGASQGNEYSKNFAKNSGIPVVSYDGALNTSYSEVDGPEGPQQLLLAHSMQLMPKQALAAEFRCNVDNFVMKRFKLGKYASKDQQVSDLFDDLKNLLHSDDSLVPALHPDIPAPQGALKRHISRREKNIAAAKELIAILMNHTGDVSRLIVQKAIGSNSQDEGWRKRLTEWAKLNSLPKREIIEFGPMQIQEYVGFPSDENSFSLLSKTINFSKGSYLEDHKSLEINLNFLPLNCLPSEFCNLRAVHVLHLHGCELSELPEEISQLVNLYEVDFGKNKLSQLPEGLCLLSRLEKLNLPGNNLKSLPEKIVHMEKLSFINLKGNPELLLTAEQKEWLLSFSEDEVFFDEDLFDRPISKIIDASKIDQIFTDSSHVKPRLILVLEKNNKTALGSFEDLNQDLANYIEKNFKTCDPIIKMAYGYARRVAMMGLFFQGSVGHHAVRHVQNVFVNLQKITGQTIDFQEEAANQASEALKLYVPNLTREHERAFFYYSQEEITAVELAQDSGYFGIDETEDTPVSIEKCIELLDYVAELNPSIGSIFSVLGSSSNLPHLIDYVEKNSFSKLGAFGNMCDDIRGSAHKFVGKDPLFAAAGYATLLGRCALFVGGGVHAKIIEDAIKDAKVLIAEVEENQAVISICMNQAVDLANTYVQGLTPEAAEMIIKMGLKFERLVDDERERFPPEEVVLRARKLVGA